MSSRRDAGGRSGGKSRVGVTGRNGGTSRDGGTTRDGGTSRPEADEDPQTKRDNYAKLCHLLYDGALLSMKYIFDQIHPAISLAEHLAKPNIHKLLRRLKVQGLISAEQWKVLYPMNKRGMSSAKYDAILLHILLKYSCKIPTPYPNEWDAEPWDNDHSLGAEIVRIHSYLHSLARADQTPSRDFNIHWHSIENIFRNMIGSRVENLLKTLEPLTPEPSQQDWYIGAIQEWNSNMLEQRKREKKMGEIHNKRNSEHDLMKLSTGFEGQGRSRTAPPIRSTSMLSTGRMNSVIEDQPRVEIRKALEKEIFDKYQKRLTESIHVDDVVGRLVQGAVLSHEDKNKIQLQMTNVRCMKMVLELIVKKGGHSFDVFCDVIKFKYKGIYNLLVEAKNAPFLVTRPDEGSECAHALRSHYAHMLSCLNPVPWCTHIQLPISEFYQPLYITDIYGRKVSPLELFNQHRSCANPKRILIEGDAGVGKSMLLKYYTDQWANNNPNISQQFKLVIYVDLKTAKSGSLLETVLEQCLPVHYVKTTDEFYNLFKMYQKKLLFILDGYEHIHTLEDEFLDLLHKTMFRDCYIIMTTRSNHINRSLLKLFDTRLLVAGLREKVRDDFITKYAQLSETSLDELQPLVERLQQAKPNLVQLFSLNPTLCMCLCLMAQYEQRLDFTTATGMMDRVITALQMRFCTENKIKLKNHSKASEFIQSTMCTFEEIAFENLMANKYAFSVDLALNKHRNTDLLKYGLMQTTENATKTETTGYFTSSIFQEFLAAKFLTRIEEHDFPRYVEALTNEHHLENLLLYYCGLQTGDYECEAMQMLFSTICEENARISGAAMRTTEEDAESLTSMASRATEVKDVTQNDESPLQEGRLSDYYLSLKCLSECEGREDLAKLVANSMPGKLYTKSKDFPHPAAYIGFGYVLKYNSTRIQHLDIRLDVLGYYYSYAMTCLATAIEKSGNISTLRLRWTSDNLLALFMATVFGTNASIATLKIYDESKRERDNITATVWNNFWSARRGMKNVDLFSFTQCRNPALVTSVIHNTPSNLIEFTLTGCTMDMVAMQELCRKMEEAANIRIVNLQGIQFRKPDFMHIAKGVKHTRSLLTLNLANTDLDSGSIVALAESLKFNRSLRLLDVSGTSMDAEGCKALGLALALNKTIHEVNFTGAKFVPHGLEDLQRMKRENVTLIGVPDPKDNNSLDQQDIANTV